MTAEAATLLTMAPDHVDRLIEEWQRERPDIDASPMGVVARISRLSRILDRRIEELYVAYGLNQSQFGVLAALRRAGPPYRLSPTELYNALLISSGAMTNRLDRLHAAGLIERIPDPNDGRSMLVGLTKSGKRLIDRMLGPHYENERQLLAPLTAEEQQQLAALLRRLLMDFEEQLLVAPNGDGAAPRSSRRPRARPSGARPSR